MGRVISFLIMKAKKNLGQNFLIDKEIIQKISDNVNAHENDLIIEIGPGMGALTKYLKLKNTNLICYEIDTDLKPYLNSLEDNKTHIIYQDILKSNIKEDISNITYNNLYIVGNLPYYITTPIIKYLVELDLNIKEMLFMVQEEVADRFSSQPKSSNYGSITLYLQYYYHINKLFKVSKKCFNPVPKVESAIIKMTKREDKVIVDKDVYFKLINDAFKMKRKNLKNNLANYDYTIIRDILISHGYNDNVRAEELSEDIFVEIANNIKKN